MSAFVPRFVGCKKYGLREAGGLNMDEGFTRHINPAGHADSSDVKVKTAGFHWPLP